MQVEAAAALAPVLARFAIVVDGPLEAEVLGRLVAAGDRATTLADLARPFPARPELSRPDAVAVARAVVTRLVAGGTVEHVGGGYRIADPGLAATLQRIVEAVTATVRPAGAAALPAPLGAPPVAVEEASRLLQQTLGARTGQPRLAVPSTAVPPPTSAAPTVPAVWQPLLTAGWSARTQGGAPPPVPAVLLASTTDTTPVVRVVVADPTAPPAVAAGRLAAAGPVSLVHLPVPATTWGQGDAVAARTAADALSAALAGPGSRGHAPVVLDRGLVPALAVLAHDDALPRVLVVDLRTASTSTVTAPRPVAAPVEPSLLAAAMAGAAGASAPRRRQRPRPAAGAGTASLLEVLFGPRFAAALVEGPPVDARGREGGHAPGPPPDGAGVVVTSRTDDPRAAALAELLGVDVMCLGAADDLVPEVLAWLEDDDGRTLLAPRG